MVLRCATTTAEVDFERQSSFVFVVSVGRRGGDGFCYGDREAEVVSVASFCAAKVVPEELQEEAAGVETMKTSSRLGRDNIDISLQWP
jgi:hypothetical protein